MVKLAKVIKQFPIDAAFGATVPATAAPNLAGIDGLSTEGIDEVLDFIESDEHPEFAVLAESIGALFAALNTMCGGGVLGAVAAWLAFDAYQASTINWQTFSQVTFAFAVTPALLVTAILWATILGLLGGLFAAISAARLPIAAALRET